MTVGRIFTKIYIFISLSWAFFSKIGNTRVSPGQNDDPVTRWPGRERWPERPTDPVTQWPSSMSDERVSSAFTYIDVVYEKDVLAHEQSPQFPIWQFEQFHGKKYEIW